MYTARYVHRFYGAMELANSDLDKLLEECKKECKLFTSEMITVFDEKGNSVACVSWHKGVQYTLRRKEGV